MGTIGEYDYSIKDIEPDLLAEIDRRVKEGKQLLADSKVPTAQLTAWVSAFGPIIDLIDPRGEDYSGSLTSRWEKAQWHSGDHPKDDKEWRAVFGSYVGVAKSLLLGKTKVVERKLDRQDLSSRCVFHRRPLSTQENLVFVLMPFVKDWSDYVWRKEIKPTVEAITTASLICKRADDLFGQDVMQDIYESIASARIILADITDRNANVFYELGMAHTLGKEVIILSQGTEHIPFDLNRFRHCIYSNDGPGYEKLRDYLPSAINGILSKSAT